MSEVCVVVGDASRARFFTVEPAKRPKYESGPTLAEQGALVNPVASRRGNEVFSDSRAGSTRAAGSSPRAYDDHRTDHEVEFSRRFAKAIVARAREVMGDCGASDVIVVASARMLGLLRQELERKGSGIRNVQGVAREMTRMPAAEIQELLARDNLVPRCIPPQLQGGNRGP